MPTDDTFKVGDKVRVHVNIKEGDKERVQIFEGNVIRKRRGRSGSFTVRKVSFGIGVERVFPFASPAVAKVEVAATSDTKRAKLYYLRDLKGKAARIEELKQ